MEARISHLAYAPEIAAAMLQRQQAGAIIAARQRIAEGTRRAEPASPANRPFAARIRPSHPGW
jgi:hypothetical protein